MTDYENKTWSYDGIPAKDCPEEEVWKYALSFNGYKWVKDQYKACKFEKLVHPDDTDYLDREYPDWREGKGDPSPVELISFVGGGRTVEEASVEELRAVLFWEQRGNRWHDNWPEWSLEWARDLIEEIRKRS